MDKKSFRKGTLAGVLITCIIVAVIFAGVEAAGFEVFYGFDMTVYVEFYSSNVNIIRKFCKAD